MKQFFKGIRIIILVICVVVFSWVVIHFLAIFGVFLAIAYPILWLIAPRQTPCLLCRAQPEGTKCSLCRRKIVKKETTSPRNLLSAILNGLLILFFAVISMGVVYGESFVLSNLGYPAVPKTATFAIPTKGQYRIGEIFPMKIEIADIQKPVNAIQADLGFDPTKVEVVEVSTKDSFANIFIQKEIDNTGGWARLTGGLPNPGFSGDHGLFGTIYFRAKSSGLIKIGFLPTSMVLANDSKGTNILKDLPSVSYLILPEKISEEEAKDQQKLTVNTNVLGISTPSGQLVFYDEKSVLAAHTVERTTNLQNRIDVISLFFGTIGAIDRVILGVCCRQ